MGGSGSDFYREVIGEFVEVSRVVDTTDGSLTLHPEELRRTLSVSDTWVVTGAHACVECTVYMYVMYTRYRTTRHTVRAPKLRGSIDRILLGVGVFHQIVRFGSARLQRVVWAGSHVPA
jgi:hypothetical protein